MELKPLNGVSPTPLLRSKSCTTADPPSAANERHNRVTAKSFCDGTYRAVNKNNLGSHQRHKMQNPGRSSPPSLISKSNSPVKSILVTKDQRMSPLPSRLSPIDASEEPKSATVHEEPPSPDQVSFPVQATALLRKNSDTLDSVSICIAGRGTEEPLAKYTRRKEPEGVPDRPEDDFKVKAESLESPASFKNVIIHFCDVHLSGNDSQFTCVTAKPSDVMHNRTKGAEIESKSFLDIPVEVTV